MDRGRVQCVLCPFNCVLAEGKTGICRGKQNIGGELIAVNYGLTTSMNLDPIEKKPLSNFYPGSEILSIGPNGCNLKCDFCQNYQISQGTVRTQYFAPEEMAVIASREGSMGIAYTYTEPLIWFEYVLDTAREARALGLKNVLVTNGTINPEPLEELLPWIDAMNVDIKSMDPAFYRKVCKGKLEPVLETVRRAAGRTHIEITNLVIPGLNDADEDFEKLSAFMAGLDELMPLHLSRYYPAHMRSNPPTPPETLERAAEIASRRLKHVYVGNVASDERNQTLCPSCGKVVITRSGYYVRKVDVRDGKCAFCGAGTGVVTG